MGRFENAITRKTRKKLDVDKTYANTYDDLEHGLNLTAALLVGALIVAAPFALYLELSHDRKIMDPETVSSQICKIATGVGRSIDYKLSSDKMSFDYAICTDSLIVQLEKVDSIDSKTSH
jgi:hypothetical protein